MSEFIGAVVGANTGHVYAIVNPDNDSELDSPRFMLIRGTHTEPVMMVRIPRNEYTSALSMDDVARIIERLVCE